MTPVYAKNEDYTNKQLKELNKGSGILEEDIFVKDITDLNGSLKKDKEDCEETVNGKKQQSYKH